MLKHLALVSMVLICAVSAHADVGKSGLWLTGTGSYIFGTNTQSGETIDGGALAITLEGMRLPNLSLGLSLAYGVMSNEQVVAGITTWRTVSTMPAYLLLRYWIGEGAVRGYAAGAVGVYISFLDEVTIEDSKLRTRGMSGATVAVPLGFVVDMGEKIFLNVNYTPTWFVSNDYIDDGLVHSFGLGFGFNFVN